MTYSTETRTDGMNAFQYLTTSALHRSLSLVVNARIMHQLKEETRSLLGQTPDGLQTTCDPNVTSTFSILQRAILQQATQDVFFKLAERRYDQRSLQTPSRVATGGHWLQQCIRGSSSTYSWCLAWCSHKRYSNCR